MVNESVKGVGQVALKLHGRQLSRKTYNPMKSMQICKRKSTTDGKIYIGNTNLLGTCPSHVSTFTSMHFMNLFYPISDIY